jgi:DNA-binding response OmpR family regulator
VKIMRLPRGRTWRRPHDRCMVRGMAQRKTILIIDDDAELRGALTEQLELHEEFSATSAAAATEGMRQAKETRPDLVLLDVDLPDMDGREACRLMRNAGVTAPIIMLTAAVSDSDTILGLDSGASDYVTKPFRFNVLLARIRAQLRNHEQSEDAVYRIGPYEFRPAQKLLIDAKGKKIRLTDKETNILKYLYRAGGKSVSREELLTEVWGYNAGVTTHTLETHVYRLRQKIEPEPANARLLLTEAGGYRLAP